MSPAIRFGRISHRPIVAGRSEYGHAHCRGVLEVTAECLKLACAPESLVNAIADRDHRWSRISDARQDGGLNGVKPAILREIREIDRDGRADRDRTDHVDIQDLSLIHISEPTRQAE